MLRQVWEFMGAWNSSKTLRAVYVWKRDIIKESQRLRKREVEDFLPGCRWKVFLPSAMTFSAVLWLACFWLEFLFPALFWGWRQERRAQVLPDCACSKSLKCNPFATTNVANQMQNKTSQIFYCRTLYRDRHSICYLSAWQTCKVSNKYTEVLLNFTKEKNWSLISEIGLGLVTFGLAFLTLGVILIFDKGLLAMGNVRTCTVDLCR